MLHGCFHPLIMHVFNSHTVSSQDKQGCAACQCSSMGPHLVCTTVRTVQDCAFFWCSPMWCALSASLCWMLVLANGRPYGLDAYWFSLGSPAASVERAKRKIQSKARSMEEGLENNKFDQRSRDLKSRGGSDGKAKVRGSSTLYNVARYRACALWTLITTL